MLKRRRALVAVAAVAAFVAFLVVIVVLADMRRLGFVYAVYDFPYGDKVGHFVLYGTLALLADLASFQLWPNRERRRLVLTAGLAVVVIESLEEISQIWMPSRTVDLLDVAASYGGIAVASLLALGLGRMRAEPQSIEVDP